MQQLYIFHFPCKSPLVSRRHSPRLDPIEAREWPPSHLSLSSFIHNHVPLRHPFLSSCHPTMPQEVPPTSPPPPPPLAYLTLQDDEVLERIDVERASPPSPLKRKYDACPPSCYLFFSLLFFALAGLTLLIWGCVTLARTIRNK